MTLPPDLEARYYASRGFDADHIERVRRYYLRYIEGRSLFVELGCGRGELLEAAAPVVGRAVGVDREAAMVEQVRALGVEAIQADALDYLRTTGDRPDAIVAAHVIEHMSVAGAHELLVASCRILQPGGVVVLVTPNPRCLSVMLEEFWSDPTHARLYTLSLLRFLMEQAGLRVLDAGTNPLDEPGPPPDLLTPEAQGAWGELKPLVPPPYPLSDPDSSELQPVHEELRRLRDGVEAVAHGITELASRLIDTRHLANASAAGLNRALRHLFGPNEIYVVGEKQA